MLFWADACKGFSGQAVFWASSGLGQFGLDPWACISFHPNI